MAAALPSMAPGATYTVSVFQVDAAGTVSRAAVKTVTVPRVTPTTLSMSTPTARLVRVRWRMVDPAGRALAGRRVAVLLRPRGVTGWRTYRYVVTDAAGFATVQAPMTASADFALRYPGDRTNVGAQSRTVVVTVRPSLTHE
jgi:hypothetical protein